MSIRTNVGNRDKLLKSTESYLQGNIDKHKANVDNLLDNNVALAEHPDIIETIEKELDIIAGYEDKLNVLLKYFPKVFDKNDKELLTD
jgi:hypothetical protein